MLHQAVYQHQGFAKLAQHYYAQLISRNPIMATWLGEHNFDGLLPEIGADAVERNIAFMRELRNAFSSLPENDLSLDERIDRQGIIHFADQQLFNDEDLQQWRGGRDLALNIGDAIFLLFIRDFAPFSERVKSMISRLKAVPMFLMSGKTLFQQVSIERGEMFLESAANLPIFLTTIENSIKGYVTPDLHREFSRAAADACEALKQFTSWLRHAILPKATADWTIGHGAFQALLATRKSGLNQTELTELGQRNLQEAASQLEALSCAILGESTGVAAGARNEACKRVRRHAPTNFDQVLKVYREAVVRTRAFISYSEFATLPGNEDLEIIETPDYMKHIIPTTAYFGPERRSENQKGFYLLTRSETDIGVAHNYAEIANSVILRGYPGYHLHLSAQNRHPGLLRAFIDNLEMIEGWAAYCQDEIREKGFETASESLFAQADEKLRSAALMLCEINLQTRAWAKEDATKFLVDQTRVEKSTAQSDIKRLIQAPTRQLNRLPGQYLLQTLKNDLQRRFANDFTDRFFHDLILYEGGIPAHLARAYFPELMQHNLKSKHRA